jgi:hypothetical protein
MVGASAPVGWADGVLGAAVLAGVADLKILDMMSRKILMVMLLTFSRKTQPIAGTFRWA